MWYIKSALKVLLKNPVIWILTIILAAVFAAPVYEPTVKPVESRFMNHFALLGYWTK